MTTHLISFLWSCLVCEKKRAHRNTYSERPTTKENENTTQQKAKISHTNRKKIKTFRKIGAFCILPRDSQEDATPSEERIERCCLDRLVDAARLLVPPPLPCDAFWRLLPQQQQQQEWKGNRIEVDREEGEQERRRQQLQQRTQDNPTPFRRAWRTENTRSRGSLLLLLVPLLAAIQFKSIQSNTIEQKSPKQKNNANQ